MGKRRWLAALVATTSVVAVLFPFVRQGSRAIEAPAESSGGTMIEPQRVALRILLGLTDQENTPWDGSIEVSPGKVHRLEIWRRGQQDSVDGNTWKLSTRPAPRFQGAQRPARQPPPAENGLIVALDGVDAGAQVTLKTAQGECAFKLSDVPFGTTLPRLEGRASVMRIPTSYQLTGDGREDDFPAAAVAPDGTVYVSYVSFTHSREFARRTPFGDQEPEDLSNLDDPTGGDQVFLMRLSDGRWSEPMAVTAGGEDVYKTAIAVDGQGRPWVFWSVQDDGNFDLYARTRSGDAWSQPIRITRDPQPDINPAAARDGQGRVWVVWQGFRAGSANILAARQESDSFSKEIVVSDDPASEWDPAIAVSSRGDVAVAWDTYARGNYDVSCRVAKAGGDFGEVVPVAFSPAQEVHPAATYDGQGRLWVAWEQGPEQWGKDFGALVKDKGAPLYGGGERTVAARCITGGQIQAPVAALDEAIRAGRGGGGQGRRAGQERQAQAGPAHSLPRLATDSAGRVWLAYRSRAPQFWCPVGTSWSQHLTCYQGEEWLSPVYVHHTDNILDNRPALVAMNDGTLLMVGSSDNRQSASGYQQASQRETPTGGKAEIVNNDLYAQHLVLSGPAEPGALEPVTLEPPAETPSAERDAVARCRAERLAIAGKSLVLLRGEFHRHTELSGDGGGDGALTDMYRYGLDAAAMDWIGNGDHDNNNGREYPWWITQKTADAYWAGSAFMPMYSYERSVSYPDGHRNVIFAARGVRTLPRFRKPGTGSDDQQPTHTPDTQLLYRYLAQFDGLCASHTSATNMGTDWRDNDPVVEPIVEIYQGCRQNYEEPDAPRAPSEADAIGGWRPNGFVWRALEKGYRLGFQASSDHVSTHISYCNVWAEARTREALFAAMKLRHVYGATDNIIADVRCGEHMMGDEFTLSGKPTLQVRLIGTGPFKQVDIVKDNTYVYNTKPGKQEVEFTWTDMQVKPGTSYYYVRGEQEDGELVWVSPMWITTK